MLAPAFAHDLLYQSGGILIDNPWADFQQSVDGMGWLPLDVDFTRAESDVLFLDVMTVAGIGETQRNLAYRAVDVFGVGSFKAKGSKNAT